MIYIYILKRYILLFDDVLYSLYRICIYKWYIVLKWYFLLFDDNIIVYENVYFIINMIYFDDIMVFNSW